MLSRYALLSQQMFSNSSFITDREGGQFEEKRKFPYALLKYDIAPVPVPKTPAVAKVQ